MSVNATERYEVAVIGAGQAGLAIGHFLALQGRRFVILEAEDSVASAWRTRWDSLVLFTPRRHDSLPGRAFPGDPDSYPTRDEVIAYLDDYAEALALPVQPGSAVRSLRKNGDRFELVLDDRVVEADQVVVATGPFQRPRVPQFASDLAPDVFQIHSANYRSPADVPQGTVLVVGGGNTGYQIARELASTHKRSSRCWRPPGAAAAATARPRHLLVASQNEGASGHGRFPDRQEAEDAGNVDRLEPPRTEARGG